MSKKRIERAMNIYANIEDDIDTAVTKLIDLKHTCIKQGLPLMANNIQKIIELLEK